MNLSQHIVNGLVLGHAYALVAIGWTLLLGVARMVNFGHGQFYMFGAFMTWLADFSGRPGFPAELLVCIWTTAGFFFIAHSPFRSPQALQRGNRFLADPQ